MNTQRRMSRSLHLSLIPILVKELLSYTQGSKEDGEKDAIDCLMEDTVSRTHRPVSYTHLVY